LAVLENYSEGARIVVSVATSEARGLGHVQVGTEHLLLGLLSDGTGSSAELLTSTGVTLPAARHMVAEVVGTTGSPVGDELPYTARAQRALERAARFSRQERAQHVEAEHVLLGVLDVEGLACQVLRRLGVDMTYLRESTTNARTEPLPVKADPPPVIDAVLLRCSSCGGALDTTLGERIVQVRDEATDEQRKPVAIIYCTACGTALGVTRS
jgi:ATP-dependent Clp protease ATP-binding subunit ClpA